MNLAKVNVIGVSLLSLFRCCKRRPFLWLHLSVSAPRRCFLCCWVFYRRRSLVVVVIIGFLLSVLYSLGVLLSAVSRCCRRRRIVVVVGGVLSLSSSEASRSSLESSVYIRRTMHATTMDPQHQAQNGPAVL